MGVQEFEDAAGILVGSRRDDVAMRARAKPDVTRSLCGFVQALAVRTRHREVICAVNDQYGTVPEGSNGFLGGF